MIRWKYISLMLLASIFIFLHRTNGYIQTNRSKRAVSKYKPGSVGLWKLPIAFEIEADMPRDLTELIRESIDYLEEHTCIRFKESSNSGDGDHVKFKQTVKDCSSGIGLQEKGGEHRINLSNGKRGCASLALVLHEILHMLGLKHEMKRPDRDRYIVVDENKIRDPQQFRVEDDLYTNSPYDLTSIMQYNNKFLQKSGKIPTFRVKENGHEFYVSSIVKTYAKPSFYDIRLLNELYGCISECGAKECKNEGYKSGDGCKCQCPKGLKGRTCKNRESRQCGKTLSGTSGVFSSKEYANSPLDSNRVDQRCSWLIPASSDQVVHLSFFDHLYTDPFDGGYGNFIEIRDEAITLPGLRMIGAKDPTKLAYAIAGPGFVEMGLKNTNGYGAGFNAAFSIISLEDYLKCHGKVCYNGGEIRSDCTCKCRKEYKGESCEEFVNSACSERTLPCMNGGRLNIASDTCNCDCPSTEESHVQLHGDRCQYFGYCYTRGDAAIVNSVQPKSHTSDQAMCSSIAKCDYSLEISLRCPVKCAAPCECVDFLDMKNAGMCSKQASNCVAQKQFMDIVCQNTCSTCPSVYNRPSSL